MILINLESNCFTDEILLMISLVIKQYQSIFHKIYCVRYFQCLMLMLLKIYLYRSGDLDDVFEMALESAQVQIKLK